MEPKNERELIIQMDGKVEALAESVDRLAKAIEKFETVKFSQMEERVSKVERFINRWGGALIAFNVFVAASALIISFMEYRK